MKTSTKIILFYLSLFLISLLILFATSSSHPKNILKQNNLYTETLPAFSVVVLQENTVCRIEPCDTDRIDWTLPKKMSMNGAPGFVRDDTLFITNTPVRQTWNFVVKSRSLRAVVTSDSSCVRIADPDAEQLTITGNGGEIFIESKDVQRVPGIANRLHLTIRASGKTVIENQPPMKTLTLNLSDQVRFRSYSLSAVDSLSVNLTGYASANMNGCPKHITVERTADAALTIY